MQGKGFKMVLYVTETGHYAATIVETEDNKDIGELYHYLGKLDLQKHVDVEKVFKEILQQLVTKEFPS